MFTFFAKEKTHYEKGQIFPFMIAILVVIVIMAMVVVNLGQIGIFKTDVSNAADAAALAGASVLSATLLSFGLKSDTLCGLGVVATAYALFYAAYFESGKDIAWTVVTFIVHYIKSINTYFKALAEGAMGWTNAKKTALTFAYNNASVDEPKLRFSSYSGSYDRYLIDENIKPGFSRFMEHPLTGFTKGPNTPNGLVPTAEDFISNASPVNVVTGYGWSQQPDTSISNSYDNGNSYSNYDNWVEVKVAGSIMYPIELQKFTEYFPSKITNALCTAAFVLKFLREVSEIGWTIIGILVALLYAGIYAALFKAMLENLPVGLKLDTEETYTDKNPVWVKVTKHKRDNDAGLWQFRYGDISSEAYAHAFREFPGYNTIEPVFLDQYSGSMSMSKNVDAGEYDPDQIDSDSYYKANTAGMLGGIGIGIFVIIMGWPIVGIILVLLSILFFGWPKQEQKKGPKSGEYAGDQYKTADGLPKPGWFNTNRHLFETELLYIK